MKKKCKKALALLLAIIIGIGTAISAFAYSVTPGNQVQIVNGTCYDGSNGAKYNGNYTVNARAGVEIRYDRSNNGAGGSNEPSTSTTIVIKSIATNDQQWGPTTAWVPLYRISRSGGYSDDVANANAIAYTATADEIYEASLNLGLKRNITKTEAAMIKAVLMNGFKRFSQNTWGHITYRENMEFLATQLLNWEIQEGKRVSFADYGNGLGDNGGMIGNAYWYWYELYQAYLREARVSDPTMPDYYTQIRQRCNASYTDLQVQTDVATLNATKKLPTSPTDAVQYKSNIAQYQKTFRIPNGYMWGNEIGQFNRSGVSFVQTVGTGATLTYAGDRADGSSGDFYVTSSTHFEGYLRFAQNYDNTSYNPIGLMTGSSNGQMKGYLYGGNGEPQNFYLKLKTEGGPQPITVRFVDESGTAINCDWTFKANGLGEQFTESSATKTFSPKYYLDNHKEANYTVQLNSVPTQYEMPPLNETVFYYNGAQALKHGIGDGCVGWGSWDYGACRASFSDNNITITLKSKPQLPVTVKFVDNDTGKPVAVDFKSMQKTGWLSYTQAFSVTNKSTHTWTPTVKKDQQLIITAPLAYNPCPAVLFSYQYGYPMNVSGGNVKLLDNGVIEIRLTKAPVYDSIKVEIRNGVTGELLDKTANVSRVTGALNSNGKNVIVNGCQGSYKLPTTGSYAASVSFLNEGVPKTVQTGTFYFDGQTVVGMSSNESYSIVALDKSVTIYVYLDENNEELRPINLSFQDGITGELVEAEWYVYEGDTWIESDTWGTNTGASFIPKFWTNNNRQTAGYNLFVPRISYDSDPNGEYILPSCNTKFIYDKNGQLINACKPEELFLSNATFDEATNTLTIKLYKKGQQPESPINIHVVDAETDEPLEVKMDCITIWDGALVQELEGRYSSASFIPQTFQTHRVTATYYFLLAEAPNGYALPPIATLNFIYTETGQLKKVEGTDYAKVNATLDEATNTIIIRLAKAVLPDMDISFLPPNSDYHFGEEVISSYYLKNNGSTAYNPTTYTLHAKLTLKTISGEPLTTQNITGIVCPGNATQLVYFKWIVPKGVMQGSYRLQTSVFDPNEALITENIENVTIGIPQQMDTPPNKFDLDGGKYFRTIDPLTRNQDYYNAGAWQEYEWINNGYVVKTYSAKLWNSELTILPDETNPSAYLSANGKDIITRSGYALKFRLVPHVEQYDGTMLITKASQITNVQYATAYYPENKYAAATNECSTLELTATNKFAFKVYDTSTYQPGEKGDGRKHFIPMWYPDGKYVVQSKTSGCWTPAGMLSYTDEANPLTIKGSLYDDWYSSGNGD